MCCLFVGVQLLPEVRFAQGGAGQGVGPGQQLTSRWVHALSRADTHSKHVKLCQKHTADEQHKSYAPISTSIAAAQCTSQPEDWQGTMPLTTPALHSASHCLSTHPAMPARACCGRVVINRLWHLCCCCPALPCQASLTGWPSTRQWTSSALHSRARRSQGDGPTGTMHTPMGVLVCVWGGGAGQGVAGPGRHASICWPCCDWLRL